MDISETKETKTTPNEGIPEAPPIDDYLVFRSGRRPIWHSELIQHHRDNGWVVDVKQTIPIIPIRGDLILPDKGAEETPVAIPKGTEPPFKTTKTSWSDAFGEQKARKEEDQKIIEPPRPVSVKPIRRIQRCPHCVEEEKREQKEQEAKSPPVPPVPKDAINKEAPKEDPKEDENLCQLSQSILKIPTWVYSWVCLDV